MPAAIMKARNELNFLVEGGLDEGSVGAACKVGSGGAGGGVLEAPEGSNDGLIGVPKTGGVGSGAGGALDGMFG